MRSALSANSRAIRVHEAGVDAGDRLLPGRGVGLGGVVVAGRPLARQAVAADAVAGRERGRRRSSRGGRRPACAGTPRRIVAAALGLAAVEARQGRPRRVSSCAPSRVSAGSTSPSSRFQRPSPSSPQRKPIDPFGTTGSPRSRRRDDRLPLGVLAGVAEVGGAQEAVGDVRAVVALAQRDQERHVGVAARVVAEVRRPRGRRRTPSGSRDPSPSRARRRCRPAAGSQWSANFVWPGVVGRDDDDLLALVAGLGHEVGVGRARLGDVRAPEDHVGGVPPVGRLRHVGLIAPDLRRGRRQVGVPVVEARGRRRRSARGSGCRPRRRPSTSPGSARSRRSGRARTRAIVWTWAAAISSAASSQRRAHEAALAALGLVGARLVRVLDDRRPGLDRVAESLAAPRGTSRAGRRARRGSLGRSGEYTYQENEAPRGQPRGS